MRQRAYALLFAAAASAFLLLGWNASAQRESSSRTLWEYKVVETGDWKLKEKQANELGEQGWELVAVQQSFSQGSNTNVAAYYFKRAR